MEGIPPVNLNLNLTPPVIPGTEIEAPAVGGAPTPAQAGELEPSIGPLPADLQGAQAVTVTKQSVTEALHQLLQNSNIAPTPENIKMASALLSFGQKVTPANLQAIHQALHALRRSDPPALEAAVILISRGLPVTPEGVETVAAFLSAPSFGQGLVQLQDNLRRVVEQLPRSLRPLSPDQPASPEVPGQPVRPAGEEAASPTPSTTVAVKGQLHPAVPGMPALRIPGEVRVVLSPPTSGLPEPPTDPVDLIPMPPAESPGPPIPAARSQPGAPGAPALLPEGFRPVTGQLTTLSGPALANPQPGTVPDRSIPVSGTLIQAVPGLPSSHLPAPVLATAPPPIPGQPGVSAPRGQEIPASPRSLDVSKTLQSSPTSPAPLTPHLPGTASPDAGRRTPDAVPPHLQAHIESVVVQAQQLLITVNNLVNLAQPLRPEVFSAQMALYRQQFGRLEGEIRNINEQLRALLPAEELLEEIAPALKLNRSAETMLATLSQVLKRVERGREGEPEKDQEALLAPIRDLLAPIQSSVQSVQGQIQGREVLTQPPPGLPTQCLCIPLALPWMIPPRTAELYVYEDGRGGAEEEGEDRTLHLRLAMDTHYWGAIAVDFRAQQARLSCTINVTDRKAQQAFSSHLGELADRLSQTSLHLQALNVRLAREVLPASQLIPPRYRPSSLRRIDGIL